jgi:hypothetical protein
LAFSSNDLRTCTQISKFILEVMLTYKQHQSDEQQVYLTIHIKNTLLLPSSTDLLKSGEGIYITA